LERDTEKRLIEPSQMKQHPFFATMDFDKLLKKEITPPFIPPLTNELDLQNFDEMFTSEAVDAEDEETPTPTPRDQNDSNFEGFTFMKKKKETETV